MSFWVNDRSYKTLEEAIIASEEYRKNMKIFSLNNIIPTSHFEHVIMASGTINDSSKSFNCRNCGAPVRSYNCEYCGTRY